MEVFVIRNLMDVIKLNNLSDVSKIERIRIEGYEEIAQGRAFNLDMFPQDHGLTLEIVDCQYPLENFIQYLTLKPDALTTVVYRYSREYQRPLTALSYRGQLPFERLVVDFGARVDLTGLSVQNLVLYNLLSATNIDKAARISTLVIVHAYNVVSDSEVSAVGGNFDSKLAGGFSLPSPPGLVNLVIPEAQEFQYELSKTIIPDIIGIIPSSFYPSRFATGIQQAREPISKSRMPDVVYELYSRSHL
jgi:hypothetical protein